VINTLGAGHSTSDVSAAASVEIGRTDAAQRRLRALFDAHFDFVWRSLRRLGLDAGAADDGAQEVFLVLSRRLDEVPKEKEKAFLFGTSMRVASDARRARSRRPLISDHDAVERARDEAEDPGSLVDRERARDLLDRVLDEMDLDLRAVFVLYELEEMTMADIAGSLDLAPGTVASRLRRARADFGERAARHRARLATGGAR
jgi:RNA polymerase sigma-70 factor (ECF subfamily)